jgi:glycosyltransferase involved in cell wall biosynthesis
MKIAIAYTQMYPPIGGASGADRRVRDIARGLNQDNNDILMYVPEWLNSTKENIDKDRYTITYINSFFNKVPILNRLFFWYKLAQYAQRDKVDAVVFYTPTIDSAIAALQLKRKGIIRAMEFCDLISANYPSSFRGFIMRLGENQLPKVNQTVFVISSFLKDLVNKNAPNVPTVILPVLVDPKLFNPSTTKREAFRTKYGIAEDDIVIAYVGGMWANYGVDNLIEAFHQVSQKTSQPIRLIIAGNLNKHPESVDAVGLVEQLNLKEKVILTGLVNTDTVIDILNAADILTVPHKDDVLNKAGLPTKLAEYACIGKAIVASKLGDVEQYFTHKENAFLTEGSNVESLSNGLFELIENSKLREYLGKNARMTALNVFSYEVNGRIMISALKKLEK